MVRAFVLTAPHEGVVQEVPEPVAAPGEAVVDVERVGVCGTDVELFTGEMAYLHQGHAWFPLRPGHEWAGTVAEVGAGVALFARAAGAEVHLLDRSTRALDFARSLGFAHATTEDDLPGLPFDAVVDASTSDRLAAGALDLVEPGGRVVHVGLAGRPSPVDTRWLVLADVTAVGVLSASPGLDATIAAYAAGAVDPRPLVAATVGPDAVAAVLAGERPPGAGPGPKVHVDPRSSP